MSGSSANLALHRFAVLAALATLGLIGVGGLVTSHGVGMAVPDWPNSYGYNMFFFPISQWVGGIFYEHTHRLAGAAVGCFTLILALWLQGHRARRILVWGGAAVAIAAGGAGLARLVSVQSSALGLVTGLVALGASAFWPRCEPSAPWLRRLGWMAVVLVGLQGLLGGLRVVLLKDPIGIVHATLAQLFLLLLSAIALWTSPAWRRWRTSPQRSEAGWLRNALALTTLLILGQLILGASMRHRHAGLAVPDFPKAHGSWWPATDAVALDRYNQQREEVRAFNPITAYDVWLHMAHRVAGVAVVGTLSWLAWMARQRLARGHPVLRGTLLWAALAWVQFLLGALTVWSGKSADIATAHVAVGSLILAGGGLLTVSASRSGLGKELPGVQPVPDPTASTLAQPLPKERFS